MLTYTMLVVGAYLLGSVPFGLLLGKMAGMDVRREGSGNIGATNVGRLLGKKLGAVTLLADLLKGVLPMMLASWWLAGDPWHSPVVALCGTAAFLGHLFPIYLGFKGGKGVATALGVFLYLTPLAALGAMMVFVLVLLNWGYVSLASLSASLLMPGLVWLLYHSAAPVEPGLMEILGATWAEVWLETLLALFFALLIWFKHRDNIGRLLRGEEKSWRNYKE
ncbi:glycerol-3-phosphate 1-O-acyltransferase PlsY [Desulfurivibrio dismutans]|uniref:glycerol-3-phosphate 1-O-acyltransferase PlsY n=1 Tax=Desulfurivibrio dismutans TaxID=1398908 RepID=UPI0023DA4489|nr:glycerol-3-phosphate 1-O-acyltransferase PlsY [Desulfurivibrio alkaliphilus]MDF1615409.1 glycerol-3-phosphate 1-O-acyltransferase PlsY [Desulfurivibrio alkaliphilus]